MSEAKSRERSDSGNEQRTTNNKQTNLWGDNGLITKLTDWQPEYTIKKGLKETVEWFIKRDNLKKYKAGVYNL